MSAQASKAARELAKQVIFIGIPELKYEPELCEVDQGKIDDAAGVIQSALADLLEKAEAITDHIPGASPMRSVARYSRLKTALKSSLEPWKAGE